ncbi:MAG: hypothetical protein A2X64_02020 [Ignavibacteria bacterium GWF2_33_9]|nr:MAG: hypothetical protein A2X64_02020 [Ignavibacteria bacterium GWF2_33_9]
METKLEYILTHSYKKDSISYIKENPREFEELIQLALSDKQPYSWRAAWLMENCIDVNDNRIQKYVDKIIEILPERQDGHSRGLMMILQKMEINEDFEGKLFDTCISIWEQIGKQPSIRISAFKLILKIMRKHPELSNEVDFLIQPHFMNTLSAGIKHSVKILIQDFKKELL